MDMDIAVALFVYNRPKHTEVVLKGLKENGVSELYVFIDGLKDKQHEKDHQQVNALIKEINWCTTYVVRQPQNIGLAISIITGVTRLTETHEAVIVLEDDCVPKEGFVSFMKKALHYYEDVPEVMHVSGFGLPLKKKYTNADVYFSPYPCSWGWGTWSKTWRSCDFNNEEAYRHLLNNEIEIYKFTAPGEAFKDFLQFQLDGKINSWLIRWYHHIFSQNGRCVWLYDSLIENQGFDGTGVHNVTFDRYNQNFKTTFTLSEPKFETDLIYNKSLIREFRRYFNSKSKIDKIKSLIFLKTGLILESKNRVRL